MNKVIFIPKKIDINKEQLNLSEDNAIFEPFISKETIYFIEDTDEILGMKLKSRGEEIKYQSDNFDILINENKKVAVISYLKESNFIFQEKILKLINSLDVEMLSIFNYTYCVGDINYLCNIKKLDLIGNVHAVYGKTKCNIPNNLSDKMKYLRITIPPNDIKKVSYLPNKIITLSINFMSSYLPNSLTRLISNNEKGTQSTFILFSNKVEKLELSNNYINNSVIIPKIPINLKYMLIRINGNFLNNRHKGIFNNFILRTCTSNDLNIFNCY